MTIFMSLTSREREVKLSLQRSTKVLDEILTYLLFLEVHQQEFMPKVIKPQTEPGLKALKLLGMDYSSCTLIIESLLDVGLPSWATKIS